GSFASLYKTCSEVRGLLTATGSHRYGSEISSRNSFTPDRLPGLASTASGTGAGNCGAPRTPDHTNAAGTRHRRGRIQRSLGAHTYPGPDTRLSARSSENDRWSASRLFTIPRHELLMSTWSRPYAADRGRVEAFLSSAVS